MNKYSVEIKEQVSDVFEIEAESKEEAIEKAIKKYNDKEIILGANEYSEPEFKICNDYKSPIELYDELPGEYKTRLSDLEIINSIRSYNWENAVNIINEDIEMRLYQIIEEVWLKDESDLSLSRIADKITEGYAENKVSIDNLENSKLYEIIECVQDLRDFDELGEEELEES